MPEIRCPKCGEVFTVDESGYAAILDQVRNAEFHKELHEREAQIAKEKELWNNIVKLSLIVCELRLFKMLILKKIMMPRQEVKAIIFSEKALPKVLNLYPLCLR